MELKNTEKQEHSVVALTIEIIQEDRQEHHRSGLPQGQGTAQDDREAVRRRRVL